MKIVFVGPSLPDAKNLCPAGIAVHPPAVQGDIDRAVDQGASAIGLIDGHFEYAVPVWHKEILRALSLGVHVCGASSMGALRAAECAAYGMTGIGRIFEDYRSGRLIDDSDVALVHAPAELGYRPMSVPLVNMLATLDAAEVQGIVAPETRLLLEAKGRDLFFKTRTWASLVKVAGLDAGVAASLSACAVDVKRQDAIALISHLDGVCARRQPVARGWTLQTVSRRVT